MYLGQLSDLSPLAAIGVKTHVQRTLTAHCAYTGGMRSVIISKCLLICLLAFLQIASVSSHAVTSGAIEVHTEALHELAIAHHHHTDKAKPHLERTHGESQQHNHTPEHQLCCLVPLLLGQPQIDLEKIFSVVRPLYFLEIDRQSQYRPPRSNAATSL